MLSSSRTTTPAAVSSAIKGIASTAIQFSVSQDLEAKLLLLSACSRGTPSNSEFEAVRTTSGMVEDEFSQLGIAY